MFFFLIQDPGSMEINFHAELQSDRKLPKFTC